MMDFLLRFVAFPAGVAIAAIVGAFFGGLAGALVSGFTSDAILQTLAAFNLIQTPIDGWQIGATFGFISSFIRSIK